MKIALLGCGNVGAEVVRLLDAQRSDLSARVGEPLELAGIAVRRLGKDRGDLPVDQELFTTDAAALVTRRDVDIVVELVGGVEPARTWITTALAYGKSVVTGNKALLAEDGASLYEAANSANVDLYYEASVAAAIPLLRPLRDSLHGDRITRVMGIVNGTTNFILWRMTQTGAGFAEALEEAGDLGYAEADPTADVEGYDAASKAAILASLAFHTRVTSPEVHREGIAEVSASDVAAARELGRTVKLLAICERVTRPDGSESVSARVYPAMIPRSHPLAAVGGAYNAVFVQADAAGALMFYGQGAGGAPTASAVLGDLVAVARNRVAGGHGPRESAYAELPLCPIGDTPTSYHVNLDVADQPGVLAQVAAVLAEQGVSISAVRQTGGALGEGGEERALDVRLVIVTHTAPDAALRATVDKLAGLDPVRAVVSVMRVEGEIE